MARVVQPAPSQVHQLVVKEFLVRLRAYLRTRVLISGSFFRNPVPEPLSRLHAANSCDIQRRQKEALEKSSRKTVFWTHMMQFFLVTVLVLEFVWIVSVRLGR